MNLRDFLMEQRIVYSLWQAPFAAAKMAPLVAGGEIEKARRVLDVGCGPGTNTHLFGHADYLGLDINPEYIEHARKKYGRKFLAVDVTKYEDEEKQGYDFILANSFLHHIDTPNVEKILESLNRQLAPGGHAHILELALPGDCSIGQGLARCDRGKYPRPLEEWRALFAAHLKIEKFEPYPLGALGVTLWNMVYCKGGRKG
jgi:SAM-dependent methyltransferase